MTNAATTTATTTVTTTVLESDSRISDAAERLHHAEVALHDAHGTHVDAWISAAADRLHEAVEYYLRLQSA